MLADLRYAIRSFRKTPGFTAIVIFTASLGIGANTAIFTVVNAVLLRPFPYDDADAIVRVRRGSSFLDMQDWASQAQGFSAIGGFRPQSFDYAGGSEAERIDGALVTGSALQLFNARTIAGRLIGPDDDRIGAERIVVVSEGFWRRLGADPAIVGRPLELNGQSYTIAGVLDAGVSLPALDADVFAAYRPEAAREAASRGAHTLRAFLRLKPGVTVAQAQQEMDAIALRLERAYPDTNHEVRFPLQPLAESVVGSVRPALMILLSTVNLVLLIACVNVANMLIARGAGRRAELAVRAAVGATRARLTRQLLAESLVLAAAGGALAIAIAYWLTHLIVALAPADVPRLDLVALDRRVLAFTAILSLLTGIVFGILPAWSLASVSLADAAGASGRSTRAEGPARGALIVAEFAVALVLLVGAGLLLRSFIALSAKEPGFDPAGLVTANLTLSGPRYDEVPARTLLFEQLEERLLAQPGVRAVAMTTDLPIGGQPIFHNLAFEGRPVPPGTEPEVYYRGVNAAYFNALGIPLLSGRAFSRQDRAGAPPVAIVNQSFVREYYPDEDPLGRRIRWASGDGTWLTIVGVAGDVRALSLELSEVPAVHVPYAQEQMPWRRWMDVAVRAEGSVLSTAAALRAKVAAIDRTVPVARVRSMEQVIAASMADRRFYLFLLGGFALLALALAAAGTYGVMSYTVAQRTREVGVRIALGASAADVLWLVMGRGLARAAAGIAIGTFAAMALSSAVTGMLFEIAPADPVTLATAAAVLLASAAAAGIIPARRAVRVDPLVALRSE